MSPETFSFSSCGLHFDGRAYKGLVYYPHPETKTDHFHNAAVVEILAPRIPGIAYGDRVRLALHPQEIVPA